VLVDKYFLLVSIQIQFYIAAAIFCMTVEVFVGYTLVMLT